MTMTNGHANGKSTFRASKKQPSDLVKYRVVFTFKGGRELVVYAQDAVIAGRVLREKGFDAYAKLENGTTALQHFDVDMNALVDCKVMGGIRRDGRLDLGDDKAKLVADNNPSRETQQGKPALK